MTISFKISNFLRYVERLEKARKNGIKKNMIMGSLEGFVQLVLNIGIAIGLWYCYKWSVNAAGAALAVTSLASFDNGNATTTMSTSTANITLSAGHNDDNTPDNNGEFKFAQVTLVFYNIFLAILALSDSLPYFGKMIESRVSAVEIFQIIQRVSAIHFSLSLLCISIYVFLFHNLLERGT